MRLLVASSLSGPLSAVASPAAAQPADASESEPAATAPPLAPEALAPPAEPESASEPRASESTAPALRESEAPTSEGGEPGAAAEAKVLPVLISLEDSRLDPDAVLQAVASELSVDVTSEPVVGAVGTLTMRITRTTVTMSFVDRQGHEVRRAIELPAEPDRQVEVIALLAGNLARDQAGELLERLRRPEPKVVKPKTATEPPKPVPKPDTEPPPPAPDLSLAPLPLRPFNLSLWHPLALQRHSERYRFHIEAGLGYGRVGGLEGFGLNVLLLDVDRTVRGVAVGGLLTRTGGRAGGKEEHERKYARPSPATARVLGVQGAGIGNLARGDLIGAEGAGIFNLRDGSLGGAQVAGIFNRLRGMLDGGQFAGVFNTAGGGGEGAQVAGIYNLAGADFAGAQISSFQNLAYGSLDGSQLAVSNWAGDVDGAQIGVVNVGGRVNGLQLGVVNIADEVDGLPLGVVNVVRRGRTSAEGWFDTTTPMNLGVKYLNHGVYTLLGVGLHPGPGRMAMSFALGKEFTIDPLYLDVDLMYSLTTAFQVGYDDDYNHGRLRGIVGVQLTPALGLFAGAGPEVYEEQAGEVRVRAHALGGIRLF